jgi:hypothetical protein
MYNFNKWTFTSPSVYLAYDTVCIRQTGPRLSDATVANIYRLLPMAFARIQAGNSRMASLPYMHPSYRPWFAPLWWIV